MIKPAMTSDQWLRYSATRFRPVRKARHISPRDSTGLARRVPFACTVHVTYICQGGERRRSECSDFLTSGKNADCVDYHVHVIGRKYKLLTSFSQNLAMAVSLLNKNK